MEFLVTFAFIGLDFVTGLVGAFATGSFTSTKMREGLFHKLGLMLAVVFGVLMDFGQGFVELSVTIPVTGAICTYICLMEALSIVENLCRIDPEIMPDKLLGMFGKRE